MQENYLAKWLNNELSEEELIAFKKTEEFASFQKLLEATGGLKGPDFNVEEALRNINNQKINLKPKVIRLLPMRKLMRIAAVIALLLAVSFFYTNFLSDKTITTPYAENIEVVLPDASEIVLNAESKISYNENKWDQKRNIDLEGEAFFKVAKGKQFTVATKDGLITVIGTQFNVENRANFFEVSCYEGLVSVTYKNQVTELPAGASFLVINGEVVQANVRNETTPSWINKESSFKSIPLTFVLNEFQRQFNVLIETQNINGNQLFTGTFSNTNIDLALQSISVPSQIKYKLEGKKVLFYAQSTP